MLLLDCTIYISGKTMNAQQTRLGEDVERLGRMAERAVSSSVEALFRGDADLAKRVVNGDAMIDDAEVELERRCLKILQQDQVPSDDVRLVISVLKMNKDVERVGDLAKDIAQMTFESSGTHGTLQVHGYANLASRVQAKLEDSLDAVRDRNVELARRVLASDHGPTPTRSGRYDQRDANDQSESYPRFDLLAKHLERVSELANNVAQTLVYMVEGQNSPRSSAVMNV